MQKAFHFFFLLLMSVLTNGFVYGQGKKTLAEQLQRDYDYITSKRFRNTLMKNKIDLFTWKQIQAPLYP